MSKEQYYNGPMIAKRYGVHKVTACLWLRQGRIEHVREQKGLTVRVRVTLQNLLDFEKKYGVKPVE